MNFRLLYTGQVLGASRTDTRAYLKHQIRRTFHPQLRRLWETNENLKNYSWLQGFREEKDSSGPNLEQQQQERLTAKGLVIIGDRWNRNGYRFIPLVTKELALHCSIDILFLRPEEPGMLINSGDIDNRVKTLFDAFRLPGNADELCGAQPESDENPFYCLLEDDRLISEVSITTDQLLLLPGETKIGPNHAFAVISVRLKPQVYSLDGLRFI